MAAPPSWFKHAPSGEDVAVPLKQRPKWRGLPELNALSTQRPKPRRDEFLHASVARREISALSDLDTFRALTAPANAATASLTSKSRRWDISGPEELRYLPINPSGSQSAREAPKGAAVQPRHSNGSSTAPFAEPLRPSNRT